MTNKDLFSGAVLIGVGLLFLGANLGTLPEVNIARLWPLILLVIGAGKLLAPGPDGRWDGFFLIFIAGIFLAHNYRVLTLRDSWPLFIVLAGLSVLFKSACGKRRGTES